MRRVLVLALVFGALAWPAGAPAAATPQELTFTASDGAKLAFVSDRDGIRHIYSVATDGSDLRRLSPGPGPDFDPRWKPGG